MILKPMGLLYFEKYLLDIKKVTNNALQSKYWQKKIINTINNISDFRNIPITKRKEINHLYDSGRWDELLTRAKTSNDILVTSGGRPHRSPFISCFDNTEFRTLVQTIKNIFKNISERKNGVLILFPGILPYPKSLSNVIYPTKDLEEYKSLHISGRLFKQAALELGLRTYCTGMRFLGYKVSDDEACLERDRIFKSYNITKPSIIALSPKVLRNIFYFKLNKIGKKFTDFNTRHLIIGGAKLNTSDINELGRLGSPKITNWIESGEIGTIAYTEPSKPKMITKIDLFETCPSILYETVDDNYRPLPFGEKGRIIVTRLFSAVQPLIRYDIEDYGKFVWANNKLCLDKDIKKL